MIKSLHVPFCFAPDPMGGTEVYVEALTKQLKALGCETTIAAPATSEKSYLYNGIPVRRFAMSDKLADLSELYGEGDRVAAETFGRILDDESPELVHLHAFTHAVSLRLVREAQRRSLPVVFTYHTPTVSCQRGTLMEMGETVCDGKLEVRRCAVCTLESRGVNRAIARGLAGMPVAVGRMAGRAGIPGKVTTALRMTELTALRQRVTMEFFNEVDRIVALCDWTRELLLRNGVPAGKIMVSRHGLSRDAAGKPADRQKNETGPLKIAFSGRVHPAKGLDVLIEALRGMTEPNVELHVYGIVQDGDAAYADRLRAMANGDARIVFHETVAAAEIVSLLRRHDILAVPSRGLETGPLVVLEAFAAGTPVIGSDVGGIAELVRHETDGLLVKTGSADAWRQALRRLVQDRALVDRLRAGVRPPRQFVEVAREMAALYESLTESVSSPRAARRSAVEIF